MTIISVNHSSDIYDYLHINVLEDSDNMVVSSNLYSCVMAIIFMAVVWQ